MSEKRKGGEKVNKTYVVVLVALVVVALVALHQTAGTADAGCPTCSPSFPLSNMVYEDGYKPGRLPRGDVLREERMGLKVGPIGFGVKRQTLYDFLGYRVGRQEYWGVILMPPLRATPPGNNASKR